MKTMEERQDVRTRIKNFALAVLLIVVTIGMAAALASLVNRGVFPLKNTELRQGSTYNLSDRTTSLDRQWLVSFHV